MERDYPYQQLNYNTLNLPSTITPYCFTPNCPAAHLHYNNYNIGNIMEQEANYNIGLTRLLKSREIERDNNPSGCPVFNSNMAPLKTNYMNYTTLLIPNDLKSIY